MSHDRLLIDTIKARFARKSSAQLREIVQANDQARWSPEAMVAADEVLQDRTAGRAEEPPGTEAAYQSSVLVTPPLADWTLAVGTALFPPGRAEAFVKPLLERLSGQFGEAQYFCTHRDVELHVWARATQGRLVRGYGWLGEK